MNLMHEFRVLMVLLLVAMPCSGQLVEEDVVVLKDGKVFRGIVAGKPTIGGTISVHQPNGRVAALLWAEIAVITRLPAGIPDSVLAEAFLTRRSGGGPAASGTVPRVDLKGHEKVEDVVFLDDGSIVRGVRLNDEIHERVPLWTGGQVNGIPQSRIVKTARVDRGISDSMLVMTYINPPKEWSKSEERILSVYAGLSMPYRGLETENEFRTRTLDAGPVFGLEAGLRLGPGIRWLTSAGFSVHDRPYPAIITEIDGMQKGSTKGKIWMVLTGAELRTFGPADFKLHAFAQVGVVSLKEAGYELSIPQTFRHLAGTVSVDDISASSLALCVGGGALYGRIGVDVHWLFSRPQYDNRTAIDLYTDSNLLVTREDDMINIIFFTVSVSIL
jgi:hypothetical protein